MKAKSMIFGRGWRPFGRAEPICWPALDRPISANSQPARLALAANQSIDAFAESELGLSFFERSGTQAYFLTS